MSTCAIKIHYGEHKTTTSLALFLSDCNLRANNFNKFAQSNLGTGPRRGSCARRWLA